jgi:lipoate-protein ligase A
MRCEEKIPGGKLLAVDAETEGSKTVNVKITGDFFLHPEDAILKVEAALTGIDTNLSEEELASAVSTALEGAELIGASPQDIARIFKKAVS